jgi:hypothetical protein
MHGANMAIRRTAWGAVKGDTTIRTDIHEDLDLAICLALKGLLIDQLTNQRVKISSRRRRTNPHDFWKYQLRGLNAITSRGYPLRPIHRIVVSLAWLAHTVQWPIYRLWDFDRRRFSWRGSPERLSPVH